MSWLLSGLASFLASGVEMVEALTIVLAVGLTRGWRSSLLGVVAGLAALFLIVVALGPSLVSFVPIGILRLVVGVLLLIFGLQWLRKAILRASGLKAQRNEAVAFERDVAELRVAGASGGAVDWTGFVVSFKGVFLEGLEVAFIVLTFGANSAYGFGPSAAGALLALILVVLTGVVVHQPLSRVPENAIKFAVGTMLTAFGTFWGAEGVGVSWRLGDVTLLLLVAFYALVAVALSVLLRSRAEARQVVAGGSR